MAAGLPVGCRAPQNLEPPYTFTHPVGCVTTREIQCFKIKFYLVSSGEEEAGYRLTERGRTIVLVVFSFNWMVGDV